MSKNLKSAKTVKGLQQINKTKKEKLFFDPTLFYRLNENDDKRGEYVIGQSVSMIGKSRISHVQTKVNNSNEEVNQEVIVTRVNGKNKIKINTWDREINGLPNIHFKNKIVKDMVVFDPTLFYELNKHDKVSGEYVFGQKVIKISEKEVRHIQTKVNNSNEEVNQEVIVEKIKDATKITINTWDKTIDGLPNKHFRLNRDVVVFDPTLFYKLNENDITNNESILDQEIIIFDNKEIHIQTKLVNGIEEVNQSVIVEKLSNGTKIIQVNDWDSNISGKRNKYYKG